MGPIPAGLSTLLIDEAARAIREGDAARGCFLASVAAHFPQDECAVHKEEDKELFAARVRDTRREPGLHGWLTAWTDLR